MKTTKCIIKKSTGTRSLFLIKVEQPVKRFAAINAR